MGQTPPTSVPVHKCPKCSGEMEFGLVTDATNGPIDARTSPERAATWVRGRPEKTFWVGRFKADGPDRLEIKTLRSVACGFLELYAR